MWFFLFQELLSYNSITPPALEVWLVIFHYPVLLILQSALYIILKYKHWYLVEQINVKATTTCLISVFVHWLKNKM